MILSDFLSRHKHDDSNLHELIPISFNMHNVLHNRYHNIGILGRYMVHTRSQVKLSGMKLPEVHGIGKDLDLHAQPEKQTTRPMVSKANKI